MNYRYFKEQPVYDSKKSKKNSKRVSACKKNEREEFIKKFGQHEFDIICETDEHWAKLKDIPIPNEFTWLFSHFLELFYSGERDFNGNVILTPRNILDYEQCFGVQFSYRERRLIMTMYNAALKSICELNNSDN